MLWCKNSLFFPSYAIFFIIDILCTLQYQPPFMKKWASVTGTVNLLRLLATSCSQFNVDLNTCVEYFLTKESNARILLHDFTDNFSTEVEHISESIMRSADSKWSHKQTLHWKINVISMTSLVIFQAVPCASIEDTWTVCSQRMDFFTGGNGNTCYDEFLPAVQKVCQNLKVVFIPRMVSTSKEIDAIEI